MRRIELSNVPLSGPSPKPANHDPLLSPLLSHSIYTHDESHPEGSYPLSFSFVRPQGYFFTSVNP